MKKRITVPAGYRVYAVGDIHGRLDLLDKILDAIDVDLVARSPKRFLLVFLGDYVDRGPDGASVIERLIEVDKQYPSLCLKGNHEVMIQEFLQEPLTLLDWTNCGGLATLMSYGLKPSFKINVEGCGSLAQEFSAAFPTSHRNFIERMPKLFEFGDYVFVHAGLKPHRSLKEQTEDDLLWIRDEFLDFKGAFPKMVVHGHTPVPIPDFRSNRINVDIGAYATGSLACLVLEGCSVDFIFARI